MRPVWARASARGRRKGLRKIKKRYAMAGKYLRHARAVLRTGLGGLWASRADSVRGLCAAGVRGPPVSRNGKMRKMQIANARKPSIARVWGNRHLAGMCSNGRGWAAMGTAGRSPAAMANGGPQWAWPTRKSAKAAQQRAGAVEMAHVPASRWNAASAISMTYHLGTRVAICRMRWILRQMTVSTSERT